MRYSRDADDLNPALDLGKGQPFKLDLADGNGVTTFPNNWLSLAGPEDLQRVGFTAYEPPPYVPVLTNEYVNAEADARILAGSVFDVPGYGPIPVIGDGKTKTNLQGLAFAASQRIGMGDTQTTTKFRDAANVIHLLTPPQVMALWTMGANYLSAVLDASWVLKDGDGIPADYADDQHWPARVV